MDCPKGTAIKIPIRRLEHGGSRNITVYSSDGFFLILKGALKVMEEMVVGGTGIGAGTRAG